MAISWQDLHREGKLYRPSWVRPRVGLLLIRSSKRIPLILESKKWSVPLETVEQHDDYIHTSMKIFASMAKSGASNMQEHQILLQMSIKLKEIANRYGVYLLTSTQLNANYKDQDNNMDDSALSGAKSISTKVDIGALLMNITAKDDELIDAIMTGQGDNDGMFGDRPNLSLNIYKNRGNKWKLIRIFLKFHHGTLHCDDLWVTDYKGTLIPNIKPLHIVFEEMEEVENDNIPEEILNEALNINPASQEPEQPEQDALPESLLNPQTEPPNGKFSF